MLPKIEVQQANILGPSCRGAIIATAKANAGIIQSAYTGTDPKSFLIKDRSTNTKHIANVMNQIAVTK